MTCLPVPYSGTCPLRQRFAFALTSSISCTLPLQILMRIAERRPLKDPDEFYVQDLVGMAVRRLGSEDVLGKVVDVFSGTGQHDTLRVQLSITDDDIVQGIVRSCMVPFAKAIVPVVQVDQKFVEIDPPEGLLELISAEKMRNKARQNLLSAAPQSVQLAAEAAAAAAAAEAERRKRRSTAVADRAAAAAELAAAIMNDSKAGATPAELSSRPSPGFRRGSTTDSASGSDPARQGSRPPGSTSGSGQRKFSKNRVK